MGINKRIQVLLIFYKYLNKYKEIIEILINLKDSQVFDYIDIFLRDNENMKLFILSYFQKLVKKINKKDEN
jgi:hypothetical protein